MTDALDDPHAPVAATVTNIKVTNKNDFDISDGYDGVPFVFPAKGSLVIPADAALHIFGWQPGADPKDVFRHVQRRWGYNTPAHVEAGTDKKVIGNIIITPVVYRLVPQVEEADADAEDLPRVPKASGKKA